MPTLVASLWRLSQGKEPIEPDPNLDEASNYLWMMNGEKPTDDQVLGTRRQVRVAHRHALAADHHLRVALGAFG